MNVAQVIVCLLVVAIIAICVYSGDGPDSPA